MNEHLPLIVKLGITSVTLSVPLGVWAVESKNDLLGWVALALLSWPAIVCVGTFFFLLWSL